jgi:cellulose synthase/poly-beta-1,6-N-acetylglucosamine synthase-like glycosyltransferase
MVVNEEFSLIRLQGLPPDKVAIKLLPESVAREHMIVPLWLESGKLVVACANPTDQTKIRQIEVACRREVLPLKASFPAIRASLDYLYQGKKTDLPSLDFGDVLFRLGFLSQENLAQLRSLQLNSDDVPLRICRDYDLVDEENIAEAAGVYYSLPYIRLEELDIVADFSVLIPWEIATKRKIIPLWWLPGMLVVATPELQPGDDLSDIAEFLEIPIQPIICSYSAWDRLYRYFYLRGIKDPRQQELEIVQWLIDQGELPGVDFDVVHSLVLQAERPLEDVLINKGIISRSQWMMAQSSIYKIPIALDLEEYSGETTVELTHLIPHSIANKFFILPLKLEKNKIFIAVSNPNTAIQRLVEALTGFSVVPFLLAPDQILAGVSKLYRQDSAHRQFIPELGELLLKLGIITKNQFNEIDLHGDKSELSLSGYLIENEYLDEEGLVEILSLQTGLPHTNFDHARLDDGLIAQLPKSVILGHTIIPLWSTESDIWVATVDPFDADGIKEVEDATGKQAHPVIAPRSTLRAALMRLGGNGENIAVDNSILILLKQLVEAGFLTQIGATVALETFSKKNLPLDKAIANASKYSNIEVAQAMAKINNISFVHLQLEERVITRIDPIGQVIQKVVAQDPVDEQAARLLSLESAERLSALPIKIQEDHVVVAFSNPLIKENLDEVTRIIGKRITPVIAYRDELEDAIQRTIGKRNIGSYLLLDGLLTRSQLNDALDFAQTTGVRLGHALVNRGYITEDQLYGYLSKQTSFPFYNLESVEIDENVAALIDPKVAHEYGILPIQDSGEYLTVAMVDPLNSQAIAKSQELLEREIHPVFVTEKDFDRALDRLYSQDFLEQSISELLERTPEDSAFKVLNTPQVIGLILLVLISLAWIFVDFMSFIVLINAVSTIFYIAFSSYKFYLVYRALSNRMEVPVESEELESLDDRSLPVYTILVPVYKEAEVLSELLESLNKLDYPTTKLDIQVLLEEDDQATIDAYYNWNPPSHFHGVVVPYGEPKTKPKACNYGLIHARGEYVVIFDAEDIPQPDQLKKIVVAFRKSPSDIACIQSKLNYYNSHQNLLTRWFTVEYSMWFDLFLPGLSASNAPIPLGGTSNHFKREVLVEIGAWDPYNVTEDADLGIRLFKRGYKTAIVESTTFEEANSQVYNWIRQRSRWIKGYIQTWLVHMRNPIRLIKDIEFEGFFSFQFVVGGTFFAALLNPIYWLLTTVWFLVEWKFIQVIFPGLVYFLGALCLFVGNFAFTYMNVAGALRREQYDMVKVALISPIYWALASVAAWMGFIQLLYKPHFWEKTTHGLHKEDSRDENFNSGGAVLG